MATTRAIERHRSASLRALGRDAVGELRGLWLSGAKGRVNLASPYLMLLVESPSHSGAGGGSISSVDEGLSLAEQRGLADAFAMLLRFHDPGLHEQLAPHAGLDQASGLERVIFDLLEQLRCQSLAPQLAGVRANTDALFEAWCRRIEGEGVISSPLGLAIYTLAHMARARLGLGATTEEIDSMIESTRFRLATLVGHALKELRPTAPDQAAFAEPAAEIARLIVEMSGDTDPTNSQTNVANAADTSRKFRMLLPPGWGEDRDAAQVEASGLANGSDSQRAEDAAGDLTRLGDYSVWTTQFDIVSTGESLYPEAQRRDLRRRLDDLAAQQAVSPQRLATRWRRIFGTPRHDDWRFGSDDGVIDGRRLGQLVANPQQREIFKRRRQVISANTAVLMLIDNSGSMRKQRFESMAVLLDTMARSLDLAGVTSEVIGFTTASYSGGKAAKAWKAAGAPAEPGRIADLRHVVYKPAEATWRQSRLGLASMLRPLHFAESVDGESLAWAYRRLLGRPEDRKVLVMLSDGSPSEAVTMGANRECFLSDHLESVIRAVEQDRRVELVALGVHDAAPQGFSNAGGIDLSGTLTLGTYHRLETLLR